MSKSFVVCPICRSPNHPNAALCATCGTTLQGLQLPSTEHNDKSAAQRYEYQHGETDLYEADLHRVGQTFMTGIVLFILALMCGGLVLALFPFFGNALPGFLAANTLAATATLTPRPTVALPTVTPAPPTLTPSHTPAPTVTSTPTSTPEPCMQTIRAGEGLYAAAARCGHLSFDVLDLIVEINDLPDANTVQEGQVIEIPWPTPTPDPNAVPAEAPESETGGSSSTQNMVVVSQASAFDENFDPLFVPTPTLPPGVMFHTVQSGETIIVIAVTYGANVEILSQLNPEVTFSQCDFGLDFGGPRCTVQLREGQLLRVPAPTPTPTIPPTASGSETPTPTPTATFNAPTIHSPSDRTLFLRDQLVTLRWVPSGTLGINEAYLLQVEDRTAGIVYTTQVTETSFILPEEWQGVDNQRHEYAWTVSVIDTINPDNPRYTTQPLTFIWEGKGP